MEAIEPLGFEGKIVELESKIEELKKLSDGDELDLSSEIEKLNQKLEILREEIYKNVTAK